MILPMRLKALGGRSDGKIAELTVTIEPGEDTPFLPVTLQTNDTQGLRLLLDECKRLKEASSTCHRDDALTAVS